MEGLVALLSRRSNILYMNNLSKFMLIAGTAALFATGCKQAKEQEFKYLIDEFADLKIMRYKVPGWESLTLQQKEYIYHLSEAAKWGRDIIWDQNCKYNLQLRKAIENILENYAGPRDCQEYADFETYAKRVFFANGIHHHYSEDKFFPGCPKEYMAMLLEQTGVQEAEFLLKVMYDKDFLKQRKATEGSDIVAESSVNFYEGVSREEVEKYYASITDESDPRPISYGLNSKVVKDAEGKVCEQKWYIDGIYGPTIAKIVQELELAAKVAENQQQKDYIELLVKYYKTGDLRTWDEYNIAWLQDTLGGVDFINGFIEDYNDPLARKGSWEGIVNFKDIEASKRTEVISDNAQWFEDNSPIDPRFKKSEVKGVSAKVINVVAIAGDAYPATPIGINLPNADWIRRDYGSKSVTIANITSAYSCAAQESPKSTLSEFAYSQEEIDLCKKYLSITDNIHTDLHECLGHGSGQILPSTNANALKEYSSTLEETRADLFGLYYMADPKLVELGILPDMEAYKAQYSNYIRNGIMVQFSRIELGRQNTEAHMQNRKLIAQWCFEQAQAMENPAIEKIVKEGKTYFVVKDYEALRSLFGKLLAEVQRIKSEGDFEAGRALVEKYAVNIDPTLHKEVLERYASLELKPFGGFVNPTIVPVTKNGEIVDYSLDYTQSYMEQMLEYGKKYSL